MLGWQLKNNSHVLDKRSPIPVARAFSIVRKWTTGIPSEYAAAPHHSAKVWCWFTLVILFIHGMAILLHSWYGHSYGTMELPSVEPDLHDHPMLILENSVCGVIWKMLRSVVRFPVVNLAVTTDTLRFVVEFATSPLIHSDLLWNWQRRHRYTQIYCGIGKAPTDTLRFVVEIAASPFQLLGKMVDSILNIPWES